MVRKSILICSLLLVVLFISACAQYKLAEEPVKENITQPEEKIAVNVIVDKNVSNDVLKDLEENGLQISGETDDYIIISGKVSDDYLKTLEKNPLITKVENDSKKLNQQVSAMDDQEAIERLKEELNITSGPYVEPEVITKLKLVNSAYVGITFRLGKTPETYYDYIEEIDSLLTEEELNSIEIIGIGRGFRAIINSDGLNKLKNNDKILKISLVH